jgi:hypothetical protein
MSVLYKPKVANPAPQVLPNTLELLARVVSVYWIVGRSSTAWTFSAVRDLHTRVNYMAKYNVYVQCAALRAPPGSYLTCNLHWRCPRV